MNAEIDIGTGKWVSPGNGHGGGDDDDQKSPPPPAARLAGSVPSLSEVSVMKMIIAIIRPEKLEAVQAALSEKEVYLMTASDVRGCGRQRGFHESFRGGEGIIRLLSKVKLEIAVNDAFVQPCVQAILKAARSEPGRIGDGKIFVLPLEACYRIRTGEEGSVAIGP
jgi:nitrogen regulatory protein P-II 1